MWLLVTVYFTLFLTACGVTGLGLEEFTKLIFDENKSKITICDSVECEYTLFMTDYLPINELLVYLPTVNIEFDPYINQYVGLVLDLFQLCDNVHFVISSLSHSLSKPINSPDDFHFLHNWASLNCSDSYELNRQYSFSVENCIEFKNKYFLFGNAPVASPRKVAFVAIKDPPLSIDIASLTLRKQAGLPKPIMLHLNNENPWYQKPPEIQAQINDYQQAFKVFRTVYYDAFKPYSVYLPVRSGALVTSYYLTNLARQTKRYHSPEVLSTTLKPSERPVVCSFAGGLRYSKTGKNEQDRLKMIEVFENFSHCELFASDETIASSHKLTKYEYIDLMRASIFVLCPTGLNPETQRPHQAFELGAIPLFLRVTPAYKDYLSGIVESNLLLRSMLSYFTLLCFGL